MIASVNVPLPEWLTALKPFTKTKPPKRNESGEVMISVENGQMVFRYGGVETQADVEGEWPGAAYVQWENIYRIAKVPPTKDPVAVQFDGSRLKIGGSVCPCRSVSAVEGATSPFVNDPPQAPTRRTQDKTFVTLVSMGIDCTDEKIASLGLTTQVEKARREKEQLISEAARLLAPLGITAADLNFLVMKTLGRRPHP